MKNWKIQPSNKGVAKYVDCYWLLEKTPHDCSPERPKLNPDPAAHLILSSARQYYGYDHGGTSATGYGSHLIFPHLKTIIIDHSQPFLIIGIKFHVGALYSLALVSDEIFLDKVVSVDIKKMFQSEIDIFDHLLDHPESCRRVLDKLLLPSLLESHEDKHSRLVSDTIAIAESTQISEIGVTLGCSQRTIERSFLRVTGLTLKQYQSMNKLENMLSYLYELEAKNINWSDIAAEFGFSDQPHLIRYLKNNIGITPGNYIKQRDLTIDAYGTFE